MKSLARKLIQQYVDGWKENDVGKIIAPLAEDCVVIESHGTTYRGIKQIRKWVYFWIKDKGAVKRWDIKSFYFLKKEQTAIFEWYFACRVRRKDYQFLGISLVKINNGKISFIHEYRMTKKPYDWAERQLNSE